MLPFPPTIPISVAPFRAGCPEGKGEGAPQILGTYARKVQTLRDGNTIAQGCTRTSVGRGVGWRLYEWRKKEFPHWISWGKKNCTQQSWASLSSFSKTALMTRKQEFDAWRGVGNVKKKLLRLRNFLKAQLSFDIIRPIYFNCFVLFPTICHEFKFLKTTYSSKGAKDWNFVYLINVLEIKSVGFCNLFIA